jgi:tetratricopeptide (TPR) repeat protein
MTPARAPLALLVLSAALCFAVLGAASEAHAQSPDDIRARDLYMEGDRHYNEGRYELAVQAFQESHRLSGRPLLLFNLANAYERLGRYAEALDALRNYEPHAQPQERAQVGARITALEARAAELGQGTVDEGLLIPGAVVLGLGAAIAATGAAFGVMALDRHGVASNGCATGEDGVTLCDATVRGALEDESLYALIADIGVGVGAAAMAAGVVLIILATMGPGEEAPAAATVLPYAAPLPGGGEVGALVTF